MKRVKVAPGKYVMIRKEVQERLRKALAASPFTAQAIARSAKLEPRGVTAMVGHRKEKRRGKP